MIKAKGLISPTGWWIMPYLHSDAYVSIVLLQHRCARFVQVVVRCDCTHRRVITAEAGRELANEWKAVFVEASAKQNEVCWLSKVWCSRVITGLTDGSGHSYGTHCHLTFNHLHLCLFSVNALKHFFFDNHFLIWYCDSTMPLWTS